VGLGHGTPSLGRLLWVHSSARLRYMGRPRAAMCLKKVIYSKASTVSPDPHGRAPDLWIHSSEPQGWSRTSTCASRTPRMGPETPPPPVWGLGHPQWGPKTEHTRALSRTQAGVRYRHVFRPSLVQTCSHTLLLPAQAETRCCHVAYCT
jgi:hypothetical protein